MLRHLPEQTDPNLLVGAATADDAGVYRIGRSRALVQTVDFFTPIVDDAYAYGQIAAANSLSDCYAMGARPITAMNIMGVPTDKVPPEVIAQILRGGADKVKEAGCALVGGHTIKNPEPIYGLSVTGIVNPKRALTNAKARTGDLLVLTKPLGTGIVTTAIKRGLAPEALETTVIGIMASLNTAGPELAEKGLVRAATDVTGFGLLGHLASMCRASQVGAEIDVAALPLLSEQIWELIQADCVPGGTRANLKTAESLLDANETTDAQKLLLADAQTSGGLLLCVRAARLDAVREVLHRHATPAAAAAVIGRIVRSKEPRITLR